MLKSKKVLLIILEVVALATLTFIPYWYMVKLMIGHSIRIMGLNINGDWIFTGTFLIAVLTFDIIWLATIKFWPLKNIPIKIVLTLLIFAFSAAVATCYMMPPSF
jgi:glucan phosphoethanolaminetransferase (alkaline phosphatase superfamily)